MRSKRRMFELLALKDKVERNNFFKQAKSINEEIKKNNSLKKQLEVIIENEKHTNNTMTAIQLKSKKWYNLQIQEQIIASESKNKFLEKENIQIQKKIAHKHHKMTKSLEKVEIQKKIEHENIEKKLSLSSPNINKGSDI